MVYWKMKTTRKLYLGFTMVILLMLSVFGYVYFSFKEELKAIELNIQTYEIIRQSNEVLTSLINMETGARGFALVGIDDFLVPYYTGKTEFQMHINKVKELTATNFDQQNRIIKLEQAAQQWDAYENNLLEIRRKVNARQATISEVVALVETGEGKKHMDEIRQIVTDFTREEERLLEERTVLLRENEAATRTAVLFGGIIAIVLAGIFCLLITLDMREKRKAEIELECARDAALEASTAKSQFLATMSHEIRTPMNAIIGMADLLWETPLTTEQEQYIRVFRTAGENLLGIINDVLDISKIEAGYLELEETAFDLEQLVEKTCDVLSLRAHEKGIELAYYIHPDVHASIIGDPGRLKQILTNLIGNAIKFTEKGEIVLDIANNKTDSIHCNENINLIFTIKDTGIGIPTEKLQQIFNQFTQVDASTTRKYGGTGLGLAICKRLVEKMHGQVEVESNIGLGSTFRFTAEFASQTVAQTKVNCRPALLANQKILIVDDNNTNRFILKKMLSTWGSIVIAVEDGKSAIRELEAANKASTPYTLLLLDGMMPEMDGFQVAEYIKHNFPMENLTIMMLTSNSRSRDIARCDKLGITSYLIKPIKRAELYEAISKALSLIEPNEPEQVVSDQVQKESPKKILLVDDSADNRMLILAYLKNTPYQVDIAENGSIAVWKFTSDKYDLVLMDMQMPVMDGYTATRKIKKWEQEHKLISTPILALTAYALKEDIQKSLDAGCDDHLAKPIRKNILLQTIAKYTDGDTCVHLGSLGKTLIYIDRDLESIVPTFLAGRKTDSERILNAIQIEDFETIRIIGHTLRGTGGGYGFNEISNIGTNLEKAAKEKNATDSRRISRRLQTYIVNLEIRYK